MDIYRTSDWSSNRSKPIGEAFGLVCVLLLAALLAWGCSVTTKSVPIENDIEIIHRDTKR